MLKNVMGIIKLMEKEDSLRQLVYDRTVAAIPFGGRYRFIDFVLSNMVNSGIANVGVFPQRKYRSLMDHVRSGKPWDLHRKRDGIFILPADCATSFTGTYRGDLECIHSHLDFFGKSHQEYVLLTNSNMICNIDYTKVFQYHRAMEADITIVYKDDMLKHEFGPGTVLETDAEERVLSLEVNPRKIQSNKLSMEMYIMKKDLLMDMVDTCIAMGQYDLVKDGLITNLKKLRVYGYRHEGYLARITSVANYFRYSMDLLQPEIWQELFFKNGAIFTKVKDEAPSKYLESAVVENSIVASGCVVAGTVKNSILFRGVQVSKGAEISNCIVMPKAFVGSQANLEYVILDKDVAISKGKRLSGDPTYPIVISRNTII